MCRIIEGENGSVDVIETFVTVIKKVETKDSAEAAITEYKQLFDKIYALEISGARVVECPEKSSTSFLSGYQKSDVFRLTVACLSTCLRLKPDFLVLVADNEDFGTMIEELRFNGIRTEVIGSHANLAMDMRRVCVNVIDIDTIVGKMMNMGSPSIAFC